MHGSFLSCSQLAFSFLLLFIYPTYRMTLLTVGWVCLHQSTVKITPHRQDYRPTWPRKSLTKTLPRWFCTGHFDKAKQHKYHRDGYIVKSTCPSCIGPGSVPSSKWLTTICNSSPGGGGSCFAGTRHTQDARTYMQAKYTHTQNKKSLLFFKMLMFWGRVPGCPGTEYIVFKGALVSTSLPCRLLWLGYQCGVGL